MFQMDTETVDKVIVENEKVLKAELEAVTTAEANLEAAKANVWQRRGRIAVLRELSSSIKSQAAEAEKKAKAEEAALPVEAEADITKPALVK